MNRWLSFACVALLAAVSRADEALDAVFDRDVLVIEASAFACHRFDIYVARTDEQRRQGLMFVRELPARTGMLFIYSGDRVASMWMANTYISLDMVFARLDGTVSSVIHDTEPLSRKSLTSIEPVAYVLELNAGTASRLAIDDRSRLVWETDGSDGD